MFLEVGSGGAEKGGGVAEHPEPTIASVTQDVADGLGIVIVIHARPVCLYLSTAKQEAAQLAPVFLLREHAFESVKRDTILGPTSSQRENARVLLPPLPCPVSLTRLLLLDDMVAAGDICVARITACVIAASWQQILPMEAEPQNLEGQLSGAQRGAPAGWIIERDRW